VKAALGVELDRTRINLMFVPEDPGGQGLLGIVVKDGDDGLEDDGAGVYPFVGEVDGATGKLHPVSQGLALGVKPREGGKEGRMDVHHPVAKVVNEGGCQNAHVSGQADELDLVLCEGGNQRPIKGLSSCMAVGVYVGALDAVSARPFEGIRIWLVTEYDHDGGVKLAGLASIDDRLQIRTSPRGQHTYPQPFRSCHAVPHA
jgi:hypothetical protein